jgi:hypothetical protein
MFSATIKTRTIRIRIFSRQCSAQDPGNLSLICTS